MSRFSPDKQNNPSLKPLGELVAPEVAKEQKDLRSLNEALDSHGTTFGERRPGLEVASVILKGNAKNPYFGNVITTAETQALQNAPYVVPRGGWTGAIAGLGSAGAKATKDAALEKTKFNIDAEVTLYPRPTAGRSYVKFQMSSLSANVFFNEIAEMVSDRGKISAKNTNRKLPGDIEMSFVAEAISGPPSIPANTFVFLKNGKPIQGPFQLTLPVEGAELKNDPKNGVIDFKNNAVEEERFRNLREEFSRMQAALIAAAGSASISDSSRRTEMPGARTSTSNTIPANSELSRPFELDPAKHEKFLKAWKDFLEPDANPKLTFVGPKEDKALAEGERKFLFTKKSKEFGEIVKHETSIKFDLKKFYEGDPGELERIENMFRILSMDNFQEPKRSAPAKKLN